MPATVNPPLQPGTHLTTQRFGYRHHGLYAGEGRVLHYRGMSRLLRRGPVEEVSLAHFTGGRGFDVVAAPAARFAGRTAVERARSRLGEDRWRLMTNNCEHFVSWCLDGTPRSEQVEAWRRRIDGWLGALNRRRIAEQPRGLRWTLSATPSTPTS